MPKVLYNQSKRMRRKTPGVLVKVRPLFDDTLSLVAQPIPASEKTTDRSVVSNHFCTGANGGNGSPFDVVGDHGALMIHDMPVGSHGGETNRRSGLSAIEQPNETLSV
jgi:hypothetical protein